MHELSENIHSLLSVVTGGTRWGLPTVACAEKWVPEIAEQGSVKRRPPVGVDQIQRHILWRRPPSSDSTVLCFHGLREKRNEVPVAHLACQVKRSEAKVTVSGKPCAKKDQERSELKATQLNGRQQRRPAVNWRPHISREAKLRERLDDSPLRGNASQTADSHDHGWIPVAGPRVLPRLIVVVPQWRRRRCHRCGCALRATAER
mmetsp:Transcript_23213/g.51239  ORF Transcript_23213/g.51239 Transcript_23213/m.51239 type:complete len:204 (+) Transcript_23213:591-1202(+)